MSEKSNFSILLIILLPVFFISSCFKVNDIFEHKIIFEENFYVRGTASDSGYFNLLENQDYLAIKSSARDITGVIVQYRVTRNNTPEDVTVSFYFGENQADVFLGSAFLAQGETHSEFQYLEMESSRYQLAGLIMRNDGFWYSVQGNSPNADVDIEPIRITIYGTFETK